MSDEIKSGYAKFPNWLMDLVEKQKVSIVDAHFWVVINNVPSGFKYRRAALINKGYSKWQIDHSIKALCDLNLIRETKINLKNVQYEAIDLQKECPETRQTMSGNSTNYVRIPDTNKTISKNINNGDKMQKPAAILGEPYLYKLYRPGPRRDRLNEAIQEIIGREYCNELYKTIYDDLSEYERSKGPRAVSSTKRSKAVLAAKAFLESLTAKIYASPEF